MRVAKRYELRAARSRRCEEFGGFLNTHLR